MISKLETENGTPITGKDQILAEIEHYYFENLYASESMATSRELHQFTQNIEIPQLTDENRTELEGLLTLEECKEALASFGNGKSPGEDEFTVLILHRHLRDRFSRESELCI